MNPADASIIGFASCSLAPHAEDKSFQIIPVGEFRANDGRPKEVAAWRLNRANALSVIQKVHARQRPLLVDYEHQTLETAKNGLPAPAAGWIQNIEWREGQGIFALETQWTPKAKAFLKSGEYRYISPVFSYDKYTGEVIDLLHIALTNNPALDHLPAIPARAAAKSQLVPLHSVELTQSELAACKAVGVSTTDFLRTKQQEQVEALSIQGQITPGASKLEQAICTQMGLDVSDYLETRDIARC